MNNDQYINKLVSQALSRMEIFSMPQGVEVTSPSHASFGDYTTNAALKAFQSVSKEIYQSPHDFAKKLAEEIKSLDQQSEKRLQEITVVSPGFINFHLNLAFILTHQNIISKEAHSKVLVEYVGPNTNKQLHIGHVLNAVVGNAVLKLLRETNEHVDSGTIYNDRGIHIIKSMYGYLRCAQRGSIDTNSAVFTTRPSLEKRYLELISLWSKKEAEWLSPEDLNMKPDHLVGWCYAKGNQIGEEDPESQEQMQEMLVAWESESSTVRSLWKKMNDWFYNGFNQTMQNYNIIGSIEHQDFFDKVWYESDHYKDGKNIILANIGRGVIVEQEDGHVEANLESLGIPNIVLLRKDKTALYITQDIELLKKRLTEDQYTQVIYVVDYRQTLQFKQLFAIVKSLEIVGSDNSLHLAYGEVRTPEGAMSSRKGNIISADYLLEEAKRQAREEIKEDTKLTNEEKDNISHQVALSAIKYGLLKYNIGSNIVFDIHSNIKFEGDTGPYIQYTYTRAYNIFIQSPLTEVQLVQSCEHNLTLYQSTPQEYSEEIMILRHLEKWTSTVLAASLQHSPNIICEYLYKLSQMYNTFYASKPIIKESNTLKKEIRLLVNLRTMTVIKKGLDLLGICVMEKM